MTKQQAMSLREQLEVAGARMRRARDTKVGRQEDNDAQQNQEQKPRYQKPTTPQQDPTMSATTASPTTTSPPPQPNNGNATTTPQSPPPAATQIDPQTIADLQKQLQELAARLSEKTRSEATVEDMRKQVVPLEPAKAGDPYFLLPDQDFQMKVHRERRRSRRSEDQLNFADTPKRQQDEFYTTITSPDGDKYTIPLTAGQRDQLFELKAKTLQSANVMHISQTALQTMGAVALGIGIVFGIKAQTQAKH